MIMKMAMDLFAEEGLKFLGIDKKVKEPDSTEIFDVTWYSWTHILNQKS